MTKFALAGLCLGSLIFSAYVRAEDPHSHHADEASTIESTEELDELTAEGVEEYPNLHVGGFGSLSYSEPIGQRTKGFTLGSIVVHLDAALSKHVDFFTEFFAPNGGIERLILKYQYNDAFSVIAGRVHIPLTWWNHHFHHGDWLQTTVNRPAILGFYDGLIPTHLVGAGVGGTVEAGHLFSVEYEALLGNGRGGGTTGFWGAGEAGDTNASKAITFGISVKPRAFHGLDVGIGYYRDHLDPQSYINDYREEVSTFHIAWHEGRPELAFEIAQMTHTRLDTGSKNSSVAFYGIVGYQLPILDDRFKPYFLYEGQRLSKEDRLLEFATQLTDFNAFYTGLRWDFIDFACLKFEYSSSGISGTGKIFRTAAQWTF